MFSQRARARLLATIARGRFWLNKPAMGTAANIDEFSRLTVVVAERISSNQAAIDNVADYHA